METGGDGRVEEAARAFAEREAEDDMAELVVRVPLVAEGGD